MKKLVSMLGVVASVLLVGSLLGCGGDGLKGRWIPPTEKGAEPTETLKFSGKGEVEYKIVGKKATTIYKGTYQQEKPFLNISLNSSAKVFSGGEIGEYEPLNQDIVLGYILGGRKEIATCSKIWEKDNDGNWSIEWFDSVPNYDMYYMKMKYYKIRGQQVFTIDESKTVTTKDGAIKGMGSFYTIEADKNHISDYMILNGTMNLDKSVDADGVLTNPPYGFTKETKYSGEYTLEKDGRLSFSGQSNSGKTFSVDAYIIDDKLYWIDDVYYKQ